MKRLLSNSDVTRASFDAAPFEGRWLASLGRPELKGTWIIFGTSGSGKTTFGLMLAKYLSRFRRTMYDSLEQGLSYSMQMAWDRTGMKEAGRGVVFGDKIHLDELKEKLARPKSPQIVVIDSITAMTGFRKSDYSELVAAFPGKLFIFIAHEKNGAAHPSVAEHIRKLSDIKIYVEGYLARIVSRYANETAGEGGEDFVIWEEKAAQYWPEKIL